MNFNTKSWSVRLTEIKATIAGRATKFVTTTPQLINDIDKTLKRLDPSVQRALSNDFHLHKQGARVDRRCWRAIALIERLYFHNPRTIGQIVLANSKQDGRVWHAGTAEKTLDLYIKSAARIKYFPKPQYQDGAAASFARDLAGNSVLGSKICQNSASMCMQLASANKWAEGSVDSGHIEKVFFGGALGRPVVNIMKIPGDCVVVIYRPKQLGDGWQYQHTMLSVGQCECMGSNNTDGMPAGFSLVNLANYFDHVPGQLPRLNGNAVTQDFQKDFQNLRKHDSTKLERQFYARPVNEIIV